MNIFCNIFRLGEYCKLRILRKRACQKSSKIRQKQGIDFQPLQIFKTMWSVFYFRLGIGNSVKSFQKKFIVPRYLRIGIGNETFKSNPHEERFRKYPRPHEDAATFKLLCSNFDKRKQTIKMPLRDPRRSVRMLWYVVNRCCDVSVFEKLRFHPSTRQHENGVFKTIHSGERF